MITFTSIALLTALAQQPAAPAYKREVPDSLIAKVKVSEDSARAIAPQRDGAGRVFTDLHFGDEAVGDFPLVGGRRGLLRQGGEEGDAGERDHVCVSLF